jgi:NitT/TauT family transport system substrate-binding protein
MTVRRVLCTVLTLLLVCAASVGSGAQSIPTIKISAPLSDDTAAALYAIKSGLFRRHGLNVDMQPLGNAAAIAAAIVGGSLQFGGIPVYTPINARSHGVPMEIVAPSSMYTDEYPFALLVKRDSPLQNARDLAGHTFASASVGDLNSIFLRAWVDQNGGDSKSLRAVELPFAAMSAAVEDGRVDMAILLGPILQQALDSGKFRVIGRPLGVVAGPGRRALLTAWSTSQAYASANPRIVEAFSKAILEANVYANAHRAETAPLTAAYTGLDVSVVNRTARITFEESIDPRDLQPLIDMLVKYNALDKRIDARELFSPVVLPR